MTGIMWRPRNSALFFGSCCCQLFCLAWTSRIPTVIWVGRSSMRGTVCRTGSRTATIVNLPSVGWARAQRGAPPTLPAVGATLVVARFEFAPDRFDKTRHAGTGVVIVRRIGATTRVAPTSLHARFTMLRSASPYRRGRHRRSRGTLELERLHHERELGDVLGGELVQLEVLQEVHAIDHKCDLVQRQRDQLIRIGVYLARRGGGPEQDRLLRHQEFRSLASPPPLPLA